jgi:REP element-mobilizing transposase RayT
LTTGVNLALGISSVPLWEVLQFGCSPGLQSCESGDYLRLMGRTFSDNLIHVVFSTKERERFAEERMDRICEFMGGIARKNGFHVLTMGATEDHVHLLVQIPPILSISKAVRLMKGGSSKWYNDTFAEKRFGWQEGFSAFSVSRSVADKVEAYIRNQKEHHKKRDFPEELRAILKKHGVKFEEDYLLG